MQLDFGSWDKKKEKKKYHKMSIMASVNENILTPEQQGRYPQRFSEFILRVVIKVEIFLQLGATQKELFHNASQIDF